jgi:hypothetical protein
MLPTAPAAELTSSDVILLMDRLGETPGAANLMVGAIGGLYKWARGRHVSQQSRPTLWRAAERFGRTRSLARTRR